MFLAAIFLLPILVNAASAISACGVCGVDSGAMCIDDVTFALCDGSQPSPGRHPCPSGMICVDHTSICVPASTVPEGTSTCQTKCGKCSANNRFACRSQNTFSLCYGATEPSNLVHKCPSNTICSITKEPMSKSFCFDPVTVTDEHMSCFPSSTASSVFTRFIAAASPAREAAPEVAPEAASEVAPEVAPEVAAEAAPEVQL